MILTILNHSNEPLILKKNILSETLDYLDSDDEIKNIKHCLSDSFDIANKTQIHKCKAECYSNSNPDCKRGFGLPGKGNLHLN